MSAAWDDPGEQGRERVQLAAEGSPHGPPHASAAAALLPGEGYARLQRQAGLAFTATIGASAALGAVLGGAIGATPWFAAKAAVVPVLLAMISLPSLSLHQQPTLGPANTVTLGRTVLVALCAAFLGEASAAAAAWPLFAAGGLAFFLDWVDGRLARATGSASPFGARLDMELDAITTMVLSGLVWQVDGAGAWVLLSGAMRYLYVGAGAFWPWLNRPPYPTNRRRFVCGVQITCLLGAMLPWPIPYLSDAIAAFGLAALTWSFGLDVVWLWERRGEPI